MWFTNCDLSCANTEPANSLPFMLGLLTGLASYHGIFVNNPLPKYIYRIETSSLSIEDLFYVDSSLANGLKQLLELTEGSELYELTFSASSNPLVENNNGVYCDLIPDGSNIYVNRTNRIQFVNEFIKHALYGCCKKQIDSYLSGLRVCFTTKALEQCTASEIENILIGQEEIGDLSELRLRTRYSGYNDESQQVQWFWESLSDWTSFELHRFLHFVTGNSRVPLGGLKNLELIIQSIPSTTALPSSHTCFNVLDLPMYTTKEQLQEKLKLCLEHHKGFGLV